MGVAAAPVIGSVIVGIVVSEAVKAIGPKIGLSDSMSNTLGMVGGMAAGYGVASGVGSTAASQATSGATSGQVGTQLPAGYGGPTNPTGSGFAGTGPGVAGASGPAGGVGGAVASPVTTDALRTPYSLPSQASVPSPHTDTGMLQAATTEVPGGELVAKNVQNPVSQTQITQKPAMDEGYLARAQSQGGADPSLRGTQPSTADKVIAENTGGGAGGGGGGEKNWFAELFTPEKTMDMAIAAMQGWGQAGMEKEKMEYPEKIAKQNEDDWRKAFPGVSSISHQYPSQ